MKPKGKKRTLAEMGEDEEAGGGGGGAAGAASTNVQKTLDFNVEQRELYWQRVREKAARHEQVCERLVAELAALPATPQHRAARRDLELRIADERRRVVDVDADRVDYLSCVATVLLEHSEPPVSTASAAPDDETDERVDAATTPGPGGAGPVQSYVGTISTLGPLRPRVKKKRFVRANQASVLRCCVRFACLTERRCRRRFARRRFARSRSRSSFS